jgi:ribulose-5-phosphate 4-epimerase/fuculose-1-phosphate aldolase
MLMPEHKSTITAFVQACHKAAEYGLVSCSSGNMSWRVEPDTALLLTSGAWLAELTPEQVAMCSVSTGRTLNVDKAKRNRFI